MRFRESQIFKSLIMLDAASLDNTMGGLKMLGYLEKLCKFQVGLDQLIFSAGA